MTAGLDAIYAERDRWAARAESARARIAKAEKTLEGCRDHLTLEALAGRVRDALAPHFHSYALVVYGPFGLGHEIAIHAQGQTGLSVGAVRFRPGDGDRLHLIDTSTHTGQFPPGSLGSLNGFNNPESDEPAALVDVVAALDAEVARHERETAKEEA